MLIQWFIQGKMYKTDLKSAIDQINKKAHKSTLLVFALSVFLPSLYFCSGSLDSKVFF